MKITELLGRVEIELYFEDLSNDAQKRLRKALQGTSYISNKVPLTRINFNFDTSINKKRIEMQRTKVEDQIVENFLQGADPDDSINEDEEKYYSIPVEVEESGEEIDVVPGLFSSIK